MSQHDRKDVPGVGVSGQDRLLTAEEAATFFGVKPNTLAKWRTAGIGPAYVKVGSLVRYPQEAIKTFLEVNTMTR